eukprot:gb/GEZN01012833.1/.p1 GENE.gb/GEZN01012833.1/~~gb/GEZN01012833.1/.p1  ORF type:complete len:224 (-),score=27.38 gb/GEZN01012833.1/:327-998(-)
MSWGRSAVVRLGTRLLAPSAPLPHLARDSKCHRSFPTATSSLCGGLLLMPRRSLHLSQRALGMEEFFTNQQVGSVGRSWRANELRLKSYEDLRKLWFVLLKERNMLYTYKEMCRSVGIIMQNPERFGKVAVSMARLKTVIRERQRLHRAYTSPNWVRKMHVEYEKRAILSKKRQLMVTKKQGLRAAGTWRLRRSRVKKIKFKGLKPRLVSKEAQPESVQANEA